MQGLCVGGEGAGVAIFVLEHTEGYRPGFMGSIVMASNMFGTLLAVFVGIILNYFCQSTECWRYAFIGGGMTGLVGLYLRYHLTETPGFIERKNSHNIIKHPIVQAMKRQWPSVLVVIMLGGLTSAIAYTIRGYLNTFFLEVMKYDTNAALYFTSFALFVMIILLPLCGLLSDKFGHRKFLHLVCVLIMLLIIPFYNMIANPDKNILMVFIGLSGIASLAASICAPAYSYAIKAFEVELRFSGVAVSWNIGLALMGGTTPVISRYLSEKFSVAAPAYYLIAAAGLFMIISLMTTKRRYTNGVLK
jgi:MHS family proline/betaine transporter-like MFS transporter